MKSLRSFQRLVIVLILALGVALLLGSAQRGAIAASPPAGTIGPSGPPLAWDGPPTGGASADESTCIEGANCDTFTLTVSGVQADWAGRVVAVKISWTLGANDYDLYIHKDSNSGPIVSQSGNGAPSTSEEAGIDPAATGTGVYTIHVVFFSVAPADPYHGTATAQARPTPRSANYVSGGITFSPSVAAKAPVAPRDGEPSNRTDKLGNFYTAGIRGFPAGVDLWYDTPATDPYMRNLVYRGQPDTNTGSDQTAVGGDGGGDVDLAVSLPDPTTGSLPNPPTLAASSLIAANISTHKSTDKGVTFAHNPAGNCPGGGACADDRQWEEFEGPNNVYLLYRTLAPAVTQIQRSTDGGLTFGPAQTAGAIGQVGYIDVHQASGTVYISGSTGTVCHSTGKLLTGEATAYKCKTAAEDPSGVAHLFFVVKVADDGTPNGTVYAAYSNDHDIFLVHSSDQGETWSLPVRVSNGVTTNVFPWIETGPKPGEVGIAWYGTPNAANNDNADWKVYYAMSYDATSTTPTFRQAVASDHVIHAANISEGGLTGTANRNLLDYFQLSFDPNGAAVISFTDDHNDFDGHTYVTHQIGGPGLNSGQTAVPTPPPAPAPTPPPADGSQVTDFSHDVADALLVVTDTDDPLDILSQKYSCTGTGSNVRLVATMKVSGSLSPLQPASNWRMNFTANAPDSTLSPTGEFTFGVSDRGDQFFVRATTDALGTLSYVWGTAVRNSDGSITYTTQGNADSGSVDPATKTITISVALSKLNALPNKGALAPGSTLVGLRGGTFTTAVNGKRDIARGGTQYTIGCAPPAADLSVTKTDSPDPVRAGGNLTYTIIVKNNGPDSATGVSLTDQLPRNAGYGSVSTTQGTCVLKPDKAMVTCNLGTIANGGSVTVTIMVKPNKKGTITNTASVSASSPPDPKTANNSASATTTVQ